MIGFNDFISFTDIDFTGFVINIRLAPCQAQRYRLPGHSSLVETVLTELRSTGELSHVRGVSSIIQNMVGYFPAILFIPS